MGRLRPRDRTDRLTIAVGHTALVAVLSIASTKSRRLTPAWMSARRRLTASVVVALIAGGLASPFGAWQISVLIGWCSAALVFIAVAGSTIVSADGAQTRSLAAREDDSRVTTDLIVLAASVASLVGVGFILLKASTSGGFAEAGMTILGVLSVLLAWALVHTVFTLRYAHLYYVTDGGIDFNGDDEPDYCDFAYLAFTIGMTYQVSDTNLSTKPIRRTSLAHSFLSYVFGTVIIAVTINIVAGIVR